MTDPHRRSLLGQLALAAIGLLSPGSWSLWGARLARAVTPGTPGATGTTHPEAPREGLFASLDGNRLLLSAQLPDASLRRLGDDPWRALFVMAIEAHSQKSLCRHVSSPSLQRAHQRSNTPATATVDLGRLFPELGTNSSYFVHASLLQYRSGVVWFSPTG